MGPIAYGLINQELERCDSGFRSFGSVQSSLVMYPIHAYGSDAHKERWLPRMAKGDAIGCFGLTEPDFGSNPGGMRTIAVKKGDRWVLNGEKRWITSGGIADVAVVWARCDDGSGEKPVRGFLVDKGAPGYSTRNIEGKFSLRASVTSELIFEDCAIPLDAMLPSGALKARCVPSGRVLGEDGVGGKADVLEDELAGDRGAQRALVLDLSVSRNPGRLCRTRKPRIPPFSSSGVRPHHARHRRWPVVIHIFAPLSTPAPPFLRRAVHMPPGSEPKSGSVRPKQPIASPRAMRGSHALLLLWPRRGSGT